MAKKPIAETVIDAALVRRALVYDAATGLLFWRHRDDVLPRVNKRFVGKPAGCPDGQYGYISVRLCGRAHQAHRLIWLHVTGDWPPDVLDHIDGNPANNIWTNLRTATRAENNRNRAVAKKGQLKGVTWEPKSRRWIAQIMLAKKNHFLGTFDTPEAAHAAYCEAAKRIHGEFARFK